MLCNFFGSLGEHARNPITITLPRESRCCSSKSVDSFCLLDNNTLSVYESIDEIYSMQATTKKENVFTAGQRD